MTKRRWPVAVVALLVAAGSKVERDWREYLEGFRASA